MKPLQLTIAQATAVGQALSAASLVLNQVRDQKLDLVGMEQLQLLQSSVNALQIFCLSLCQEKPKRRQARKQ